LAGVPLVHQHIFDASRYAPPDAYARVLYAGLRGS